MDALGSCVGELVHCAFQREHPRGIARGACEHRRHGVGANEPVDALVVWAGVQLRARALRRLGRIVEGRRRRDLVVAKGGELAFPGRAALDVLFLLFAGPPRR